MAFQEESVLDVEKISKMVNGCARPGLRMKIAQECLLLRTKHSFISVNVNITVPVP